MSNCKVQYPLGKNKISLKLFLAVLGLLVSTASIACPSLRNFYDLLEKDPTALIESLDEILEQCYGNSEYFALEGAAYLSLGDLLRALENLERALLLDPSNGSAAVDFAEVLYRQGQVISALEINSQLLLREDLPDDLREAISRRHKIFAILTVLYVDEGMRRAGRAAHMHLLATLDARISEAVDAMHAKGSVCRS